jgi:hypothetical protein
MMSDRIDRVDDVVWSTDNKTIFYVTEDPVTKRHDKFWRHIVSTDVSDLVYEERDELFDLELHRSLDKEVILLQAAAKTSTEAGSFRPHVRPRHFASYHGGNRITSTTSSTAAVCSISAPTKARRTFGLSLRRSVIHRRGIGKSSFRIERRSRSNTSTCSPDTRCSPSGRTGCRSLRS